MAPTFTTNYSLRKPDPTDDVDVVTQLNASLDTIDAQLAAAVPKALVDAKGDLIAATAADTVARVAVGANGRVLAAASAATPGVEWSANPTPAPVVLTDGATVPLNAAAGKVFRLTAAGDRTIAIPTNLQPGMGFIIAHTASGAAWTLTLTTSGTNSFQYSTDITGGVTALTATPIGSTDYIGVIFDGSRCRVLSYAKGFA